jgi:predicted DNA-binding transcriptional regulator YafY
MPKNKNALIRFRLIDDRLRNKYQKYPSKEDLRQFVSDKLGMEISESTIEKDMKAMRSDSDLGFMAPIAYHKLHRGYYYSDENYTIANVALSEDDLDALNFATTVLEQFKDNPIFSRYTHAIDRIVDAVNLRDVLDTGEENFIHLEQVPEQEGLEFLPSLINAIRERRVLEIDYLRFEFEKPKTHVVHPYLLKEYRNRWYLIGMNHKHEFVFTLGLDRMQAVRSRDDLQYVRKYDFDPVAYFENVIGITVMPEEPQDVVLSFRDVAKEYVKSLPWHHSQEVIEENEKELIIKLHVVPTPELKLNILSNGEKVKVLQPKSLQDDIAESIRKMKGLYE